MGSILFLLFVGGMVGTGVWFWRKRVPEIAEEAARREQERALAMGLVPHLGQAMARNLARESAEPTAAPAAASPSSTVPANGWKLEPLAPPPGPAPIAAPTLAAAPIGAKSAPAPTVSQAPDAATLRSIKRSRFARLGLAYFEATGFQVQQHRSDAPIDALLFTAGSKLPAMAVRWSRREGQPADAAELLAFVQACADLYIARGTFFAQHGADASAVDQAAKRGVVVADANQFALKLAALPPEHFPRLHAVAQGAK